MLDGSTTKKIASDVISYSTSNDNIVYLTFDDNLFMKTVDDEAATKIASDVVDSQIVGKTIVFQDTDSKVFQIGKDGKKTEQASNVEKLRISNDNTLLPKQAHTQFT